VVMMEIRYIPITARIIPHALSTEKGVTQKVILSACSS